MASDFWKGTIVPTTVNPWDEPGKERKAFYRPLDLAIRWCGLFKNEAAILSQTRSTYLRQGDIPQWPALYVRSESLRVAMESGALPFGSDGQPVNLDTFAMQRARFAPEFPDGIVRAALVKANNDKRRNVDPERRTISHADFAAWIRQEFPEDVQKPHMAWLFDDEDRVPPSVLATEAGSTLALQATIDRLSEELEIVKKRAGEAEEARRCLEQEKQLDPRQENTYLHTIHALAVMNKLRDGAAIAIEKQVLELGYNSPLVATINKVLDKAYRKFEGNPQ